MIATSILSLLLSTLVLGQNASIPITQSTTPTVANSTTTDSNSTAGSNVISTQCNTFMTGLNSDEALSNCTSPIVSAVSLFNPTSSTLQSATVVNEKLKELCGLSSCSEALIMKYLMGFTTSCLNELENGNEMIVGIYDLLYLLNPFYKSICTQTSTSYCLLDLLNGTMPVTIIPSTLVNTTATNSTSMNSTKSLITTSYHLGAYATPALNPLNLFIQLSTSATQFTKRLYSRSKHSILIDNSTTSDNTTTVPVTLTNVTLSNSTLANSTLPTTNSTASTIPTSLLLPNSTTFSLSALPYLFLSPLLPSNLLCTNCTKEILANYVGWESKIPYALGLSNSKLLGGQGSLWTGVGGVCGGGFLESTQILAGEVALSSGAVRVSVWGGMGFALVMMMLVL